MLCYDEILEAVLDRARDAFKAFFARVEARALAEEYDTYIAPRQKEFGDIFLLFVNSNRL